MICRLISYCNITGKLASLNHSWQSKEGTYCVLGMAGIEPTPSKSECDWALLSPLTTRPRGQLYNITYDIMYTYAMILNVISDMIIMIS